MALQYVLNQTEEICLAAVNQDGLALQNVLNQTPRIVKAALLQDNESLIFISLYPKEMGVEKILKACDNPNHIVNLLY